VKLINRIARPAAISGVALLLVVGAAFAAGGRLPDLSVPHFPSGDDSTPTASATPGDSFEAVETAEPSRSPEAGETAEPSRSPEASETPEAGKSAEPVETAKPSETAESSETPEADETHSADGSGDVDDHGGDRTNSPKPSSGATESGHGGDSGSGK